jgi:hypothetical protein
MPPACSKGRRCAARTRDIDLTDDHFRKGPYPPRLDEFHRTCSFCRGTRPVAVGLDRGRECPRCHNGLEWHHFWDGIVVLTGQWLILGRSEHVECNHCRARRQDTRAQGTRNRAQAQAIISPRRSRRAVRPPRHYDSSPDMDQPRHCDRALRNPNHPRTTLRDFIDEVDGRQRPTCNACRLEDGRNTIIPARRQREEGGALWCPC